MVGSVDMNLFICIVSFLGALYSVYMIAFKPLSRAMLLLQITVMLLDLGVGMYYLNLVTTV